MNLIYKRATLEDIDILVEKRIEVLRAANKLCVDTDMSEVEKNLISTIKKLFVMVLILHIWFLMRVGVLEPVGLVFFR